MFFPRKKKQTGCIIASFWLRAELPRNCVARAVFVWRPDARFHELATSFRSLKWRHWYPVFLFFIAPPPNYLALALVLVTTCIYRHKYARFSWIGTSAGNTDHENSTYFQSYTQKVAKSRPEPKLSRAASTETLPGPWADMDACCR